MTLLQPAPEAPGTDVPALLHPFTKPSLSSDCSVRMVRGEGAAVFDDAGGRYVDAMAWLWYCNVGHARGEVVDAVTRQMRELETYHCFERFAGPRGFRHQIGRAHV